MHRIRVGTCGWSYQDWSGVFYPKGLPAGEYLPYLAEQAVLEAAANPTRAARV
jgi:uncharacterized protein YecE (DUF72 family)